MGMIYTIDLLYFILYIVGKNFDNRIDVLNFEKGKLNVHIFINFNTYNYKFILIYISYNNFYLSFFMLLSTLNSIIYFLNVSITLWIFIKFSTRIVVYFIIYFSNSFNSLTIKS